MNDLKLVDIMFHREVNGEVESLMVYACMMRVEDSELFPGEIDISTIHPDSFMKVEEWVGGGFKAYLVRQSTRPEPYINEFIEWMKSDAYNVQVD